MKHIKYLFSFLLIFGLTVNECSVYSQINSASYHQVSYINTKKEISYKYSELYVYTGKIISKKVTFITQTTYRNLRDVYSTQIQIILRSRIKVYQQINSLKAQRTFLSKIITSSNHYSSL